MKKKLEPISDKQLILVFIKVSHYNDSKKVGRKGFHLNIRYAL